MTSIKYVKGDATQPQGEGTKLIAHICNDIGAWGAGFVVALSNKWTLPEAKYRSVSPNALRLGAVQLVRVEPGLLVVNMIAQHKVRSKDNPKPIRYDALRQCLTQVWGMARSLKASVHMPRIGTGLAGGKWEIIEEIIEEELCENDIEVVVCDFE